MTTASEKTALRKHMLGLRRKLAQSQPHAGAILARRFPVSIVPANSITAGYIQLGNEINPAPLLTRLRKSGRRLALPCLEKNTMLFRLWDGETQNLVSGENGLLQPPQQAEKIQPDILLVPLLAFDNSGNRLGRGGGHYDRAMSSLLHSGLARLRIGLAWQEQLVSCVPTAPHDIVLDRIETPLYTYTCS